MLYVGVDAHKSTSQVTVMDANGNVIQRKRIASSPMAVRQVFSSYQEPLKAVLEASYAWAPMYDWLDEVADEVVLAHPLKVRAIAEARIKTDKIDSETLAHLLRADLIPEAHASSKDVRARRRVLRQRMFLIRLQTMVKNRIRALVVQHSFEPPKVTDLFGKSGRDWLRQTQLPDPDGQLLREDLTLLEFLQQQIARTDKLIAELAKGDEAVRQLASVPGVGVFLSVLIRWEVDRMERFHQAKKFASYTGLVPSTYASGNRTVHGKLTKQGNKWLRWAFIEAVSPAVRSSPYLRTYYQRIKLRRGVKDARAATARKIAELAWTVWTEHRYYEERSPNEAPEK
jgi:transposase